MKAKRRQYFQKIKYHPKQEYILSSLEGKNEGNTCLHLACEWGASLEIIKFLVKNKFSINVKNFREQTPFHLAIIHERYDIFDYILLLHTNGDVSIDINAATGDGETPLHLATSAANPFWFMDKIVSLKKIFFILHVE